MSKPSGVPDQNYKPSTIIWDDINSTDFAWEGDSTLGAAFVQIVDASGDPIVSFGGGTQYTDAGTPPTHPVGPTIIWNNAGTWNAVSDTQPLPITVKNSSLAVTGTFWQTTQPVSLASLPNSSNLDVALSTRLKPADTLAGVTTVTTVTTVTAVTAITNALPAGSAIIGKVGIDQTTPGTTNAVQPIAGTTGGYTPNKLISAASTNATSIKGSAGTLGYITASNINASPRYLKIYNKASAPTVGTDTPVHTFLIPGNTNGTGTNIPLPPQGIALGTGIAIALTTGVGDSDTGAVAANEIVINYGTK